MANAPTPEEAARKILDLFVGHFNLRAGDALGLNNFMAMLGSTGFTADEFNAGLEYAVTQGWIEKIPRGPGVGFKLTATGFAEA